MKVNGKNIQLEQTVSLLEFLEGQGYVPAKIAVERNGEIVPRAEFGSVQLCDEDSLEIVCFVGGG